MKRMFFLPVMFILLMLVGCESEEVAPKLTTTYQVFNNSEAYSSKTDPYLNGSMYDVVVFCFAGDDIVREDSYPKIPIGGKTVIKEVPEAITKIKTSFKMVPEQSSNYNSSGNNRKYVVSFTLIEKGKNVIAEINGDSMIKGTMIKEAD